MEPRRLLAPSHNLLLISSDVFIVNSASFTYSVTYRQYVSASPLHHRSVIICILLKNACPWTIFRARLRTKPFTNRVRPTYVICYKNYDHSIVLLASNLDLFTVLTFK